MRRLFLVLLLSLLHAAPASAQPLPNRAWRIAYWLPDGIHVISRDGKTNRLLIPDGREPAW